MSELLNSIWLGSVEYQAALSLQERLVRARTEDRIGDTLLLLEHPHVFTLGRGADEKYVVGRPDHVPIYRVSRGGQVTYHGPGQLVGYPILKLEGRARDVHAYLRNLEQVLIDALRDCTIDANRRDGLTGVWVGTRKIASLGVGIKRWVTLHGMALNVAPDLSYFDGIIPCGIDGCRMTSIEREGHPQTSVEYAARVVAERFAAVFQYRQMKFAVSSISDLDADNVNGAADDIVIRS